MTDKLSVLLTAKNEQHNILACIDSVRSVADEIVVADSGSTDGTLDLVRSVGDCRLLQREYINSGNFKNWAIPQCRHPWVLVLDCDERLTEEMAQEIRQILAAGPAHDGYWVYRENYFLGHRIRHGSWGNDKVLRLFRKEVARYVEHTDHAEVHVATGNVGRLRNRMPHFTVMTYQSYQERFFRYARQQAELWHRQGRRPSVLQLWIRGPLRFFHNYVIRGGFLDGAAGLQVSLMIAAGAYLKQALLWELYYGRSQQDVERRLALHRTANREAARSRAA